MPSAPPPVTADDKHVPESYEGTIAPAWHCRAWNPRREKYCRARAGSGTAHPGAGRCRIHDGGGDRNTRHGQYRRYAGVTTERVAELYAAHAGDENPLDLFPELALLRALVQDFVERYHVVTPALLAWHASWGAASSPPTPDKLLALGALLTDYRVLAGGDEDLTDTQRANLDAARELADRWGTPATPRPHQVLDITDVRGLLGEIRKAVEAVERVRAQNAISLPELQRLMAAMGRVVEFHVKDPAVCTRISEAWLALRV